MPLANPSISLNSPVLRYLAAAGFSALFVGLRFALEPTLQEQAPLMALLAAPILSAWLGGLGPGLAATLICAVAGELLFVRPHFAIFPPTHSEWLRLAIFVSYGSLFSWLIDVRRRALRDLTRKHDELAKSERRVRETLEASPSAMIVVNGHGAIELVNEQAQQLFGYSRDELIGMGVEELVPESVRGGHAAHRERYQRQPAHRAMGRGSVLFARRKDGSVCPVEIGLNPVHPGTSGLVLASVLDVSQRHAAEQALREAARRKDEFIAVLAHELRNPLAPVRSAVEIIKRLAPGEPRLQLAREIIDRQVSHMARLIEDLLDVSRITRGQLCLQKERCDLSVVARQVAEDYRMSMEGAGLSLVVHEPPHPMWVDGDPVRLAQMVGNIVANAQRFNTKDGSVEVSFRCDRAARIAEVVVTNTGPGIDASMLPRLFDAFEQAPQDLARSKGGLGLGLHLTKGLAELHGGTVHAHSGGAGQGATFTVGVPMLES